MGLGLASCRKWNMTSGQNQCTKTVLSEIVVEYKHCQHQVPAINKSDELTKNSYLETSNVPSGDSDLSCAYSL